MLLRSAFLRSPQGAAGTTGVRRRRINWGTISGGRTRKGPGALPPRSRQRRLELGDPHRGPWLERDGTRRGTPTAPSARPVRTVVGQPQRLDGSRSRHRAAQSAPRRGAAHERPADRRRADPLRACPGRRGLSAGARPPAVLRTDGGGDRHGQCVGRPGGRLATGGGGGALDAPGACAARRDGRGGSGARPARARPRCTHPYDPSGLGRRHSAHDGLSAPVERRRRPGPHRAHPATAADRGGPLAGDRAGVPDHGRGDRRRRAARRDPGRCVPGDLRALLGQRRCADRVRDRQPRGRLAPDRPPP